MFRRTVIRIRAQDSPNVRLGLEEIARGLKPSNRILVPGVLTYAEYKVRCDTWDEERKTVGLHAEFYEGPELLLFPPEWLDLAEQRARLLRNDRRGRSMGIDVGEGAANTCWTIGDELGIIKQRSQKTPNTAVIPGITLALAREYRVPARNWVFDAGGGGKEHADVLRAMGHPCRTVSFGSAIVDEPKWGYNSPDDRLRLREQKVVYINRRAQMYGEFSQALNPSISEKVSPRYAIPAEYKALREQLSKMPKLEDERGRLYLPPKNRRPDKRVNQRTEKTLTEIIGHSPDEADSAVLMYHGLIHKPEHVSAY